MPGVKKLFQESENSAKPDYIHGHMFGGLGILAGNPGNWACIPLMIKELLYKIDCDISMERLLSIALWNWAMKWILTVRRNFLR